MHKSDKLNQSQIKLIISIGLTYPFVDAFILLSDQAKSVVERLKKDNRFKFKCDPERDPSLLIFSASAGSLYLNIFVLPKRITQPMIKMKILLQLLFHPLILFYDNTS